MENTLPSFWTKDFLKDILESGLKISNIEIDDFTISPASGTGENYTSEIHRVCVSYKIHQQESQQISLILKNIKKIMRGNLKDTFEQMDIYSTEINMYTKVIPQIEKLFKNSITFGPKCFEGNSKNQFLVLTDLKGMGYELQDRVTGLDEAHCAIVMKKIAQLHAGSMCVIKTNPNYRELFNHAFFNEFSIKPGHFSKVFTSNFEQMIDVVKSWPEFENIAVKLEKICENLMNKGFEHCKRKEGELQVINHGDLWVNNMMFKYNKNNNIPSDVAFIDLQLSYFGSLGIDINYFFNTSPQLQVLKEKRTKLLKIYYESLKSTLEQLKYSPIPTWEDVCKEVRAKEFYGFAMLACIFPIISMDKIAAQNVDIDIMSKKSERKRDAMFNSERILVTLKYSLKRFDELGVLDE